MSGGSLVRRRIVRCHRCDGDFAAERFFGFEVLVSEDWPADSIGVFSGDEELARIAMPGWRVVTLLDRAGDAVLS